ncbi:hypothetical protein XFF6990_90144 [Xanthomonas citri pv. fuscans]|nr:hypothetical protein XFF6990_90144 [Xanthomonas citri pv. fuscans]
MRPWIGRTEAGADVPHRRSMGNRLAARDKPGDACLSHGVAQHLHAIPTTPASRLRHSCPGDSR